MIALQVPTHVWGDGENCCSVFESRVLTNLCFRFFETEGTAVVTMLVSRYKLEVKEEPEFAGETFEERYARITAFYQSISTT